MRMRRRVRTMYIGRKDDDRFGFSSIFGNLGLRCKIYFHVTIWIPLDIGRGTNGRITAITSTLLIAINT